MDIDHDTSTHWKPVWGQEKKTSLRGTSYSHNPELTWTSAQSGAALKVREDASTYINHEWSHHKKNSNAHERQSAWVRKHFFQHFLTKASIRFFLLLFFMIHLFCFQIRCRLHREGGSAGLNAQLVLLIISLCLYCVKLLWVKIHLAQRANRWHQGLFDCREKTCKTNPKCPFTQ